MSSGVLSDRRRDFRGDDLRCKGSLSMWEKGARKTKNAADARQVLAAKQMRDLTRGWRNDSFTDGGILDMEC